MERSRNLPKTQNTEQQSRSGGEPGSLASPAKPSYAPGGYEPHPKDVGSHLQFDRKPGSAIVGKYLGPTDDGLHEFETSHGKLTVPTSEIHGLRPVVGGLHPPGQERPPEGQLDNRVQLHLSVGDGSEALARIRQHPELKDKIAVTTYGKDDYTKSLSNAHNMKVSGIPILVQFDIKDMEGAMERLKELPAGGHLHFQMPRVPQGTKGFSSKELVSKTLKLGEHLGSSVSITVPDPGKIQNPGHSYGLHNNKALEDSKANMKLDRVEKDDSKLEEYGYEHKQTTKDESTEAANRRHTYHFVLGKGSPSDPETSS